ncbi:MAG: hypothetical protein BRC41_07795 [Cyanobacteria bacterium QH_9_48_43]|nr:MAG: hypothetical protein BRC41_07795 [Cyanobacteria bacterium QH_9_48_43]PSO99080.1 MAG: hypothetical protein BRC53_04030 [Cyanobacteria bacterium SW_6_48_11]
MLISDLNHLSTVSEASDVVGGDSYYKCYEHKKNGKNGDNGDNGGSETTVVVKQIAKSKAKAFSEEGDAVAVSKAINKALKE